VTSNHSSASEPWFPVVFGRLIYAIACKIWSKMVREIGPLILQMLQLEYQVNPILVLWLHFSESESGSMILFFLGWLGNLVVSKMVLPWDKGSGTICKSAGHVLSWQVIQHVLIGVEEYVSLLFVAKSLILHCQGSSSSFLLGSICCSPKVLVLHLHLCGIWLGK
jgi:hypothetical protein